MGSSVLLLPAARRQLPAYCSAGWNRRERNLCQRLKRFESAPNANANAACQLCKIDHIVRQEDKHRAIVRIGLPPTSERSGPTDCSHAASAHEVCVIRLQHHRNTQAESSTDREGFLAEQSGVGALAVCELIRNHLCERLRVQEAHAVHRTGTYEYSCKVQIIVDRGPEPCSAGFISDVAIDITAKRVPVRLGYRSSMKICIGESSPMGQ
jgi:hypothetical protein